MAFSMASSFCPEGPARGTPCFSSYRPGASVTIMMSALGLPEEKTGVSRRDSIFRSGGQLTTSSRREDSFSSSVSPSRAKEIWRGSVASSSVLPGCTPLRMSRSSLPKETSSTESGGWPGISGGGCVSPETGGAETEEGISPLAIRRASMTHFLKTVLASSVTAAFSTPRDNRARR